MKQYRIIISGGGTGGHIFPAISIANTFKKRFPNAEILFVGASDRMEMEKVIKKEGESLLFYLYFILRSFCGIMLLRCIKRKEI